MLEREKKMSSETEFGGRTTPFIISRNTLHKFELLRRAKENWLMMAGTCCGLHFFLMFMITEMMTTCATAFLSAGGDSYCHSLAEAAGRSRTGRVGL